jgi:hypothetical protein
MTRALWTSSQPLSTASSSGSRARVERIFEGLHKDACKELDLDHFFDESTGLPLLVFRPDDVNEPVPGAVSEASTGGGTSTIEDFLDALNASESVESVSLSLDLHDRPYGLALLETAFARPNLRELHLFDDAAKPSHFAEIVSPLASQQLQVISLSNVDFRSQSDVLQLSNALRRLPALTVVRIHDMILGHELDESSMMENVSLDPLLDSLSMLRQVETLELSCVPRQPRKDTPVTRLVSETSLTRMFQKLDRLSDITLWSLGVDALHMDSLKYALRAHPSLSFLSLRRNEIDWTTFDRDVLIWNTTLCHVYGDFSEPVEDQILVWLFLNRLGRGHALTSIQGEGSWLKIFDIVCGDPSLVYALLISDPTLLIGLRKK